MINYRILVLVAIILYAITGCSVFGPVQVNNATTYELNTVPHLKKHNRRSGAILVMPMQSNPIYDTTQIAYSLRPYQVAYFAKNQWATTPAQMIQLLIVQTLQNSGYFRVVSLAPVLGHYNYILTTRLIELRQMFMVPQSVVRIKMRAELADASTGKIIASREFSAFQTAPQNTPYSGVQAANIAVANVLKQLLRFCVVRT